MTLIYILIYVVGYIVTFMLFGFVASAREGGYLTIMDIILIATISLLSWVTLTLYTFLLAICYFINIDLDKKIKWP